jgi:hypothetical protein
MKTLIRAAVSAALVAVALAFSGSAFAAINPKFSVGITGQPKAANVGLDARVGQSDDWIGRLQIYLPAGFKLSAPVGGTQVGTGQVTAIGTLVGPDQIFTMSAKVMAIGTTDPAVSFQTTNCDNVGHLAAWMVQAQGGDDSWSFPIFVDQTTGTETQFGSYKLVACFGPRSPGSTNSESNKFIGLSLSLNGFVPPTAPGDYKWRSLWTPFAGDQSPQTGNQSSSALNPAGSVEAQSTTRTQTGALTISAKRAGAKVVLTGKLIVNGEAMNAVTVAIRHGSTKTNLVAAGTVKTTSAGSFVKSLALGKALYFQAGATLSKQDLGPGGCSASFGVPCVDATVGGTAVLSKLIHLTR